MPRIRFSKLIFSGTLAAMEIIVILATAFLAGFVDAIGGGGGLIQVPALFLMYPQLPPAVLLGTNKLPSSLGTLAALISFRQKVTIQWRLVLILAILGVFGSLIGASTIRIVPPEYFQVLVIIFLLGAALLSLVPRKETSPGIHIPNRLTVPVLLGALGIGFYDGFFGPGAGSLLVILLASSLRLNLVAAAGHAKAINVFTNVAALLYFAVHGLICLELAIPMSIMNILGGLVGSKLALTHGKKIIKPVLISVLGACVIRLIYQFMTHA